MSFVGLHIHSDYSLLDGASQLDQLVDRAQELQMPAIALTDHGVMYGAVELLKVCKGKEVNGKPFKPIIGNEMYIINGTIDDPKNTKPKKYHQVTLAKNKQGYKNLVKLTTISHLQGYKGKGIFARPCIDKTLLAQYHEGLIVTSSCLGGEVPQMILQNRLDEARSIAQWYQNLFGEDYYIEIQDHGSQEDRMVNVELVRIAREFNIEIIATNDSHYISCFDVEAHDALLCILTGKRVTDEKRLRYSGTEYLKSAEEMRLLFRDHLPSEVIEEALANTLAVAEKIEEYDILGQPRIPNYPVPEGYTGDTYMAKVAQEGLQARLNCPDYGAIPAEYKNRLDYEIQMMQQMGFSTYFLVVWDYIKFARDHQIPVGPGRGSAAGSLVAYAMEITNIDPVHHGLLFERFLNPERKSMPDIDTDFCIERREEVIEYVTSKYGDDRVAQIITFNRMTSKAVLRDVGRVLNIPLKKVDEMAKMIPVSRGKPTKLKVMISSETPEPEFKKKYEDPQPIPDTDPPVTYRRWIDMAIRIEGTNKTFGVHAAGVVISADPLDEIVPLQRNNDGSVITQYYMEDVEAMGLLKMDFLALKNLTMIQKTVELIEQYRQEKIDPDQLPLDDSAVYEILAKGDLEGIFQVESSGMRQIVRDLRPSNLEDISSILALYRPGPLDAGLIPKFINRKHGREAIDYAHEILKPILGETYGIMVYQEQIMRIAQDMAGYSLGQADLLRRAMGKKKLSEMQKHEGQFIEGSAQRGVSTEVAKALWDDMVKFAEYCFNKSHSTAYGYVTFQTAYLKAHYAVEYMAALLTVNSSNQDKVQKYIANCQSLGIQVESPDINRSGVDFTPLGDRILFGLSAVRNVGQGAIEGILAVREQDGPFQSLADLCDRVDSTVRNRRVMEALIHCGALDSLEPQANRHQLIEDLPLVLDWAQSRAKDRDSGQGSIFDLLGAPSNGSSANPTPSFDSAPKATPVSDYSQTEKLMKEKELLGFYVSDHPLKAVQQAARILAPVNLSDLENYVTTTHNNQGYGHGHGHGHNNQNNHQPTLSAIVMLPEVKLVTTKKGDKMAILVLEDLSAKVDGVVFPKAFERIGEYIQADAQLMVWGTVDRREEQLQFIVEDAEPIDTVRMVMVELDPKTAGDIEQQHRLCTVLQSSQGDRDQAKVPVVAIICSPQRRQFVRLGTQFRVQNPEVTVQALRQAHFQARSMALITN